MAVTTKVGGVSAPSTTPTAGTITVQDGRVVVWNGIAWVSEDEWKRQQQAESDAQNAPTSSSGTTPTKQPTAQEIWDALLNGSLVDYAVALRLLIQTGMDESTASATIDQGFALRAAQTAQPGGVANLTPTPTPTPTNTGTPNFGPKEGDPYTDPESGVRYTFKGGKWVLDPTSLPKQNPKFGGGLPQPPGKPTGTGTADAGAAAGEKPSWWQPFMGEWPPHTQTWDSVNERWIQGGIDYGAVAQLYNAFGKTDAISATDAARLAQDQSQFDSNAARLKAQQEQQALSQQQQLAQQQRQFAAGIKPPTVDDLFNAAVASGDFQAALQLHDIANQPTQQQRLQDALAVAQSPADYASVMGMLRGELPIQQQSGGTFRRIGPQSAAFDAYGFTGFGQAPTFNAGASPLDIYAKVYQQTRDLLMGQGVPALQASTQAQDKALAQYEADAQAGAARTEASYQPGGPAVSGPVPAPELGATPTTFAKGTTPSGGGIAATTTFIPTGGQTWENSYNNPNSVYYRRSDAFDAPYNPANGGAPGFMSSFSPAVRSIYLGQPVGAAAPLTALGAPQFQTDQTYRNMLPSEQDQFTRALQLQGISPSDYEAQRQGFKPLGPRLKTPVGFG